MATTQKESDIAPQASHTLPDDHLEHSKSTAEVIHNAKQASDNEHRMTLMQGIKLYPKAVGWSILISTCIVMEGYDVCLLSNFCKYQTLHTAFDSNHMQLPLTNSIASTESSYQMVLGRFRLDGKQVSAMSVLSVV